MKRVIALFLLAVSAAMPVRAAEIYGGVLAHAVDTPLTKYTGEGGADFELGWRSSPIVALGFLGRPSVHVMGSANSAGDTDFAAAGLDWKLPIGPLYIRPGIGVAVQDGPRRRVDEAGERTDLGSRVLFEPELSIGTRIAPPQPRGVVGASQPRADFRAAESRARHDRRAHRAGPPLMLARL